MHTVTMDARSGKAALAVTEEWLQECSDYVSMFSGIKFTPENMLEIFVENENLLVASLREGFETGEREWFQECFAKRLLGIGWPTYGESKDPKYENFHERLQEAAKKAGYEVA